MDSTIKKYKPADEYYFQEGCFITEVSNSADDPELSTARNDLVPASKSGVAGSLKNPNNSLTSVI